MENLTIISTILGAVLTILNICVIFSKPIRQSWLKSKKAQQQFDEEHETILETDRCILRDRITTIYYKYFNSKQIKTYQFENVTKLYTQYKKLNGNSFIDKIYEEISTEWEIIT